MKRKETRAARFVKAVTVCPTQSAVSSDLPDLYWPPLIRQYVRPAAEENHCGPLTEQGARQQIDAGAPTQSGGDQLHATGPPANNQWPWAGPGLQLE